MMSSVAAPRHRIHWPTFGLALAISYSIAALCLLNWGGALGFSALPFQVSALPFQMDTWVFWGLHVAWLGSVILMFRRFGSWAALSLLPAPLFLLPLLLAAMLIVACNAGSCV